MIGIWLGCAQPPPDLRATLPGAWVGTVELDEPRDVVARFWFADDGLAGDLWELGDEVDREYALIAADSVEGFGLALRFVERTGVRDLFLTALAPVPPLFGFWESRVFCGEGEDGYCRESGAVLLDRP